MIEWKKDSNSEEIVDEHYSHLKKQGSNMLGERSKIPFIIIGGGILCLIVLFFVLNPRPPQNKFPDVRPIEARLDKLEERLNKLEVIKDQVKNIEDRLRIYSESQASQQELEKAVQSNSEAISEIQKRLADIGSGVRSSAKPEAAASPSRQESASKVQGNGKSEPAAADKHYHTVQKGETLFRISQKYGISLQKLQEINNIDPQKAIYPGQKLTVGPVGNQ